MSVHLLEELSSPALDALPRESTVVILTASPLETHGPHLPLGVDAYTGRYFAQAIAERIVSERSGWHVVLAPTLHLGTFAFETVGTVTMRQRVVRDLLSASADHRHVAQAQVRQQRDEELRFALLRLHQRQAQARL